MIELIKISITNIEVDDPKIYEDVYNYLKDFEREYNNEDKYICTNR